MSSSSPLTGVAQNELAWQLLQAMPEAVFLVDADSLTILATNAQAERLTGRPSAELLDQQVSTVIETLDGSNLSAAWQDLQKSHVTEPSIMVQVLTNDGHRSAPMAATCSLFEADSRLTMLLVINDDTELVRLREVET